MGIKKKISILLGKPLKEAEMDSIVSKKKKNITLSDREKYFYKLYKETEFKDQDYMMLSKNVASNRINNILINKRTIVCNLHDRDGLLGYDIISVENKNNKVIVNMTHNMKHEMTDNFLYNILFDKKRKKYSLEEHDEYFEKVNIDK